MLVITDPFSWHILKSFRYRSHFKSIRYSFFFKSNASVPFAIATSKLTAPMRFAIRGGALLAFYAILAKPPAGPEEDVFTFAFVALRRRCLDPASAWRVLAFALLMIILSLRPSQVLKFRQLF